MGIVENLLRVLEGNLTYFIQFSTDNVFSGADGRYNEATFPEPINVYGRTKLQTEQLVADSGLPFAIALISLVYGPNRFRKPGADEDILRQLEKHGRYSELVDEFRSPTLIRNICDGIERLIAGRHEGVFHFGQGKVSRYELAGEVARLHGFALASIEPVNQAEVESSYPRAADTSLVAQETRKRLGLTFHSFIEGLALCEQAKTVIFQILVGMGSPSVSRRAERTQCSLLWPARTPRDHKCIFFLIIT